jgi:hypothetical protein
MQTLTLKDLQRIKQWHVDHREDNPLEYHLWDTVLTLWLMAWIGWMPALLLDANWALPLCPLGLVLPQLYVQLRSRAHDRQRLRCDWREEFA